jgi:uncharacterized protein (TIGR02145 family)
MYINIKIQGEAKMRNLALMWVLAACLLGCGGKTVPSDTDTTFTDKRDGKVYKIVKIGSQTWFAENLNYLVIGLGSSCYDDEADNCAKYGRLYNWETAKQICPIGWRLPSDDDWTALVDYTGNKETAGTKLKSTAGWNEDGNGKDDFGFSALPGGIGNSGGNFNYAGNVGYWWSSTEGDAQDAWGRDMYYYNEGVDRNYNYKTFLFSVRCVQDDEKEGRK